MVPAGNDPHVLGPGLTPTPFTSAEIRAGCPDGRTIQMRIEADRTTIVGEPVETPLGLLECLRYTVTEGDEVSTFWFARSAPGMPIRFRTTEGGRVRSEVTVVEDRMP